LDSHLADWSRSGSSQAGGSLVLAVADREPLVHVEPAAAWKLLLADEQRWRGWCDVRPDPPQWQAVIRSLLILRLLTY
jgi:hypothetical protein